jgi:hypothetical protein
VDDDAVAGGQVAFEAAFVVKVFVQQLAVSVFHSVFHLADVLFVR